ncbi:MAG: phosphodiester glycosidase family protein [Chloroflexi bacterium]|nr:phosphodiester glycosidase family protein [Chloroflexota bacterium]
MPLGRFEKQRVQHETGGWSTVYSLEIAPHELKFEDLHPMSSYVRQQDIARMHYARAKARGDDKAHILTWTAMQTDRRAEHIFPGLDYSFDGERIISANSFVACVLRQLLARGWLQLHEYIGDTYEWHAEVAPGNEDWQSRAEALTRWLEESIQLDLYPNIERGSYQPRLFREFDARRNFVRIGRCDFVRHFVQHHERVAAFNTSHFLHEHDDLVSHHSGYGDAIGLMVSENTILRPPLYQRGCLLFDGAEWTVGTMSLADVALILPDDISMRADARGDYQFRLNPVDPSSIALYTRAARLAEYGRPLDRTPAEDRRHEFIIVNRQVLGWKQGGDLQIPQNGFVLSLSADTLPESTIEKIAEDAWIEYEFADPSGRLVSGVQAGPILLKDGRNALESTDANEEFWASRGIGGEHIVGITPVNIDPGAPGDRKARTALGIKEDGNLLLLVVDGCDPAASTELDSAGATLSELSDWLAKRGAIQALNMSGEGSSHLFVQGGLANRPSDRRGQQGVVYERMLASIGIVG